jgi:hypothetical protein
MKKDVDYYHYFSTQTTGNNHRDIGSPVIVVYESAEFNGQSGTATGFSTEYFSFACQYYSNNTPSIHSFIY